MPDAVAHFAAFRPPMVRRLESVRQCMTGCLVAAPSRLAGLYSPPLQPAAHPEATMGRGDKRTRKGKIWRGSYGNSRPKGGK